MWKKAKERKAEREKFNRFMLGFAYEAVLSGMVEEMDKKSLGAKEKLLILLARVVAEFVKKGGDIRDDGAWIRPEKEKEREDVEKKKSPAGG